MRGTDEAGDHKSIMLWLIPDHLTWVSTFMIWLGLSTASSVGSPHYYIFLMITPSPFSHGEAKQRTNGQSRDNGNAAQLSAVTGWHYHVKILSTLWLTRPPWILWIMQLLCRLLMTAAVSLVLFHRYEAHKVERRECTSTITPLIHEIN